MPRTDATKALGRRPEPITMTALARDAGSMVSRSGSGV
jgi:hypothetical protein